jgi:hypothetical protein
MLIRTKKTSKNIITSIIGMISMRACRSRFFGQLLIVQPETSGLPPVMPGPTKQWLCYSWLNI